MTSELVERLRNFFANGSGCGDFTNHATAAAHWHDEAKAGRFLADDAADAIERLTAQLAEARQAERAAVWVYPKNIDDMPKKPGKESYEYVPCLIIHKGDVLSRHWNCEHQVFDDEYQDDYYCDWWEITAYMDLSALIKAYAPPVTGEPA